MDKEIDVDNCSPEDKRSLVTILAEIRKQISGHEERLDASDLLVKSIQGTIERQAEMNETMAGSLKEINDTLNKYLPLWVATEKSEANAQTFHRTLVEHTAKGIVWGTIVLIGLSVWNYVKHLLAVTPPPS